MKLYADTPARRVRQVAADLLAVSWIVLWIWVGRQVHDVFVLLRAPADSLTSAGDTVHDAMSGAGDQASRIPAVGDDLKGWLDRAAGSGTNLRDAGTGMADTIETVATWLGWVTALVPILIVAAAWLFVRLRFVRQATTAQRFIDANEDLDLFALRALANQPMTALARVSDDPAGSWRRQEPVVIRALAALELKEQGLRLPRLAR